MSENVKHVIPVNVNIYSFTSKFTALIYYDSTLFYNYCVYTISKSHSARVLKTRVGALYMVSGLKLTKMDDFPCIFVNIILCYYNELLVGETARCQSRDEGCPRERGRPVRELYLFSDKV